MNFSRLRHSVAIQAATESAGTRGENARSWATVETVWAAIEPLNARETFYAQQVQSLCTHRVRMRYNATVTPKHRILYGARLFYIEGVTHTDERGRETICQCVEQLSGATHG